MSTLYDIIIIGGGINGCALARAAARKGFATLLLEKDDFGAGVTSRSTRLVHGGLRYLESFQFKLVKESLRDRRLLLDEFPGQVSPQPFLIPVYKSDSRGAWYIQAGLFLYGLLARDPELGGSYRLKPSEVKLLEPGLDRQGLTAAFRYFDCQAVYPERLSVEMALRAGEAGADVRNHAPAEAFLREGDRVVGVRSGGGEFRGKLVINATGPWIEHVRELLGGGGREPLLTRLNGAHIVVKPFPDAPQNAIYHEARSDKRPFFIVPWRKLYLIGTTETPYDGDPDRVIPNEQEIEYLLREFRYLFPEAGVDRGSVLCAYAGSRPLVRATGSMNSASRDHYIHDHESSDGVKGLLTMVGGKLTTARSFAEQTLEAAAKKLGAPSPGLLPAEPGGFYTGDERLYAIYGARARRIDELADSDPDNMLKPAAPGAPATVAEILHCVRHEKARTLGDILLRRTGLAFEPDYDPGWPAAIAEIVKGPLQWDDPAVEKALAGYQAELERTLARV